MLNIGFILKYIFHFIECKGTQFYKIFIIEGITYIYRDMKTMTFTVCISIVQTPESPNFKVTFTLNVIQGGGPRSQFYLIDIGSCWKNNGQPCDGDVESDVTRYSEMIINPNINGWCRPDHLNVCPPYHTFSNGTRVHRKDTARYPYAAYHLYCSPGNGQHLEDPYTLCDPFSNPQPQEILQILPHPVWGDYGYPTKLGEGWIGDSRTWKLDVGRLSHSLYFYQVYILLSSKLVL